MREDSNTIAIVIPAYKSKYLALTLQSLANQTDKDFTVYIGDDNSPDDIFSIVNSFSSQLRIKYKRFEENIGKHSLVEHWKRCVDLTEDEQWIWLFSDDDIVQSCCVESFRKTDITQDVDVLHFNIDIINYEGNVIKSCQPFPNLLSSADFFNKLYTRVIDARMPEFIFRASKLKLDYFINFDLAWRSDNATVMHYSFPSGILTITGNNSKVLWRVSDSNISSPSSYLIKKNHSTADFYNWVNVFFIEHDIKNPMTKIYFLKSFVFQLEYRGPFHMIFDCILSFSRLDSFNIFDKAIIIIFSFYRLIYRQFERI